MSDLTSVPDSERSGSVEKEKPSGEGADFDKAVSIARKNRTDDVDVDALSTVFDETVSISECIPKKPVGEIIDPSKVLYVSLNIPNEAIILLIAPFLHMLVDFIVNIKFHITLLYTGGKENENFVNFIPYIQKSCLILVDKIAISEKFCTLGVSSIQIDGIDIPYCGNIKKHITIARKNKKYLPKDSPTAFSEGVVTVFDEPHLLTGVIELEMKK